MQTDATRTCELPSEALPPTGARPRRQAHRRWYLVDACARTPASWNGGLARCRNRSRNESPRPPRRVPSLVSGISPRCARSGTYSGRYSRSPVAGLYQTRIGLPVAGSVKTSLVG